jgi:hypothetical protein
MKSAAKRFGAYSINACDLESEVTLPKYFRPSADDEKKIYNSI